MTTIGQTMGADARPVRPASKAPSVVRRLIDRVIDTPADLGAAIARIALAVRSSCMAPSTPSGGSGLRFHGHAHVDDEDPGLPGASGGARHHD